MWVTIMAPDQPGRTVTAPDPMALLLGALAWICADDDRAARLLALTGLGPDDLRTRATDPEILVAIGHFLGDHEPDLVSGAEALDCPPGAIPAAARTLSAG